MSRSLLCISAVITLTFTVAGQTLIVANKEASTVSLVNLTSGTVTSTVAVGKGPHEVSVSPDGKIAVVSNYGDQLNKGNSLTIIDIQLGSAVREISLGEYLRPHGIEFVSNHQVLVTCETNQVVLIVNTHTSEFSEVAKTNQKGSHMVSYAKSIDKAFVTNVISGTVSVIDVGKKILLNEIAFTPGIEGLAVTPDSKELWVANRNDSSVVVVDIISGKTIARLPAHQVAYRIAITPDNKYAFVSNGLSGNVSVYDITLKKHLTDIELTDASKTDAQGNIMSPYPVGLTSSQDSQYIFVSLAGYNEVSKIGIGNWQVISSLQVGEGPDGIGYSPLK